MLRSHSKYTRLEIVLIGFRKSCALFTYPYTENCIPMRARHVMVLFFFYLQNYIPHRAQTTSLHQPQSTHTKPSSLGLQFLKAPHLLALAMNSFRRGPSICQNAAVCVTSVKWLMQNLKQNSSKSSASYLTAAENSEKAFSTVMPRLMICWQSFFSLFSQ